MKTVSTEEMNKVIAEWMQLKSFEDSRYGLMYPNPMEKSNSIFGHSGLKYHSSWDWLKPVIDKIFTYALAYPEQILPIRKTSIVVEIEPAHEMCYEFIVWLNNKKLTG